MFEELGLLLCVLLGLACALISVTVIGHGLWLAVASIFGSSLPAPEKETARAKTRRQGVLCPSCSTNLHGDYVRCPYCGHDLDRKQAEEQSDLEAAARTIQRLKERGTLTAEACEQIYRSIEARQNELLADEEPRVRLERWFAADFGAAMTVGQKKEALALAKAMSSDDLRLLKARTLVGIARLQTAVGMSSRASQTYQVLFESHPTSKVALGATVDALEVACKIEDWRRADAILRFIRDQQFRIDETPRLRDLIAQIRARGKVVEPDAERRPSRAREVAEQGAAVGVDVDVDVPAVTKAQAAVADLPQPIESVAVPTPDAPAPVEPSQPRRSFGEWVAVFMEQRNILWGELIGGSLIVGCSIALVISLWDKLADIRYFPFLIFAAITSALFSAGFYTLHHWKLDSTSRGLLIIGTLLAPLNFSILAGLPAAENALLDYLVGAVALGLFGWLLYRATRVLVQTPLDVAGPCALLVTAAMMVSAAVQVATPGVLANADWHTPVEFAVSLTPVLGLLVAIGWILWRLWAVETWTLRQRTALAVALGSTVFSTGAVVGFLLFRSGDLAGTLLHLAPSLTLFGAPILIAGIMLQQKLAGVTAGDGDDHERLALWRTLGTGIWLAGLVVMFAGFAAGAEDPFERWLCGLLNVAVLLAAGWCFRMPALLNPGQLYLGVLFVTGGAGDIVSVVDTPNAALRLTSLMALQLFAGEICMRLQRWREARIFAIGGGVSTVLAIVWSLALALGHPGAAAIVIGTAALAWLAANVRWRIGMCTYACAALLPGAIFFALRHVYPDGGVRVQILWALLIHATACIGAATLLRRWPLDWLRDVFRAPLQFAGLVTSVCAVGVIAVELVNWSLPWDTAALACVWLAALWLTLAVLEGWPILFGCFQAALGFAWLFAAGGRLESLGWDWREPYSLHLYGVGLGLLCLGFELCRLALRERVRPMALLTPTFVPVDRVLTAGLVLGQFALAALVVLLGAGRELIDVPNAWRVFPLAWYDNAYTVWPWLLGIVLLGVLAVWLGKRDLRFAPIGCAILLVTMPLLAAGAWFDETLAVASATRWGLAIAFLVGSFLLWNRPRLAGAGADAIPVSVIRAIIVTACAAPSLLLTAIVVVRKLTDLAIPGPVDGIFAQMGGPCNLLIPLGLFSATLAGHGFRERIAGYLGGAGALANATCVGAFFLALQMQGIAFGQAWVAVDACLIVAGVAWLWSMLWTALASRLEQGDERPMLDSPLLTINSAIGTVFLGGVLGLALVLVIFKVDGVGLPWIQAVGSIWTWLAYASLALGATYLAWTRHARLSLHHFGLLGVTALGVATCSAEVAWPGQGYRALMLMCGGFACVWAWGTLFLDAAAPPRWLRVSSTLHECELYSCIAGGAAALLGGVALFTAVDAVWSAVALALTAVASVLIAYQRRAEIWMTLVTLLLMLAGSILVTHFDADDSHFALRMVQINLSVLGICSLARLAFRRLVSAPEANKLWHGPAQLAIGMVASLGMYFAHLAVLIANPGSPDEFLECGGDWAGWLALASNAGAAVWYVSMVRPRWVLHTVALGGLMAAVALAGSASQVLAPFEWEWIGHHVLTLCWTLLALGLMIVSWASHAQPALGPRIWSDERRTQFAQTLRGWFPENATRTWVSACGAFVVLLALRATTVQPDRPYWSIANIFTVSVLLATLAVWARAPAFLYGAGLLFNIVGLLVYTAWSAHRLNLRGPLIANDEWLSYGILAQVISFGTAAALCSLLERRLRARGVDPGRIAFPFAQFALMAGMQILAIGVCLANVLRLLDVDVRIGGAVAWIALGVLAAAAFLELWRPHYRRLVRYHLFGAGLLAIGLTLHGLDLSPLDWYRIAALLLAGYVLAIAVLRRAIDARPRVAGLLHLRPGVHDRGFWMVQLGNMILVAGLSVGIVLTNDTFLHRIEGAGAAIIVLAAAFVLARTWANADAGRWLPRIARHLVLALLPVVAVEASWACLDPEALRTIWLQRSAAAFAVVVMAVAAFRYGLSRWLADSRWIDPARTLRAVGGFVTLVLVVALLGNEFVVYDPAPNVRTTPLLLALVIAVGLALIGLTIMTVHAALVEHSDVYGLEGNRRSTYVYVAEVFVIALIAHLRLNVPDVLPKILGQYWYLAVMVFAFVWLALSEMFGRKQLAVLASPLRVTALVLAVVPVIAFRLGPVAAAGVFDPLRDAVPGIDPFLGYLKRLGEHNVFGIEAAPMESLCWLLLGIFLATWARLRDSANLGVVAALAVNFGVWVLLDRQGATGFAQRPQLWLIPLGLIILAAEFINRERLGFWPSLSVRYAGLLCIYLSSTIEMFMEGLGHPLFAIILALLAVAGVMLGILLRIRAFVLTGFLALLVVIFAQIWHAAVERGNTWVWWASGILLGVLILVMFALFEKHRNEVVKAIDSMKRWN